MFLEDTMRHTGNDKRRSTGTSFGSGFGSLGQLFTEKNKGLDKACVGASIYIMLEVKKVTHD